MRPRRGSLIGSLLGTGAVNAGALAIGIVTSVLTARGLGPTERGLLVGLTTWMAIVGGLALVGLDEAIIYRAEGRRGRALALRRAVARQATLQAVIGSLVLGAVAWVIVRPETPTHWLTVALATVCVPQNTVNLLGLVVLRAEQSMWSWNMLRSLPSLVYLFGILVLVSIGELTLLAALAFLVAGGVLTSLAITLMFWRAPKERLDELDAIVVSRFGKKLMIAMLPAMLNPRIDQMLMSLVMSAETLGVYSVAVSVSSVLLAVAISVDQVVYPRFVSGASDLSRVRQLAGAILLGCLLLSSALWVVARELISLVYGSNYVDATVAIPMLLAAASVRAASSALASAAKARGDLRTLTVANITGLIVGTLAFLALARFGMLGASASALASAVATASIMALPWVRIDSKEIEKSASPVNAPSI